VGRKLALGFRRVVSRGERWGSGDLPAARFCGGEGANANANDSEQNVSKIRPRGPPRKRKLGKARATRMASLRLRCGALVLGGL
jgi:hypothetical protein